MSESITDSCRVSKGALKIFCWPQELFKTFILVYPLKRIKSTLMELHDHVFYTRFVLTSQLQILLTLGLFLHRRIHIGPGSTLQLTSPVVVMS